MLNNLDMGTKIAIGFVIVLFLLGVMYNLFTGFTKQITVKSKFNKYRGGRHGGNDYMVEDSEGNLYKVVNVWWRGEFDKTEDWTRMEEGKTYTVKGYGFRWPMLGMYPNVYTYH